MTPEALKPKPKFEFDGPYDHLVTAALVLRSPSSRVARVLEEIEALPDVLVVYRRVTGSTRLWVTDKDPRGAKP